MLHLLVIIFSDILISLIKILREERLDHPNYRQNSSPFSLCCCISLIGRKLDNFQWRIQARGPGSFPPPPKPLSKGLDDRALSLSQRLDPALILYSISLRHPRPYLSLTGHPTLSLMRVCDTHISSYISMHVSPAEDG